MNTEAVALPSPRRLSRLAKMRLALEILASYIRARWGLRRRGVERTVTTLRRGTEPLGRDSVDAQTYVESMRLGSAVARTLRLVPLDSRCLMASLVLIRVLARRGLWSALVIGVRPGPAFGAHAWVELGGRALLPTGAPSYRRLAELCPAESSAVAAAAVGCAHQAGGV